MDQIARAVNAVEGACRRTVVVAYTAVGVEGAFEYERARL